MKLRLQVDIVVHLGCNQKVADDIKTKPTKLYLVKMKRVTHLQCSDREVFELTAFELSGQYVNHSASTVQRLVALNKIKTVFGDNLKLDFCRIQNTKSDISYLKKNLMHFDAFDLISVLHVRLNKQDFDLKNEPTPVSFPFIFCLFNQTLYNFAIN